MDDYKIPMTKKKIKCVVWDLDNTVWQGTLSEDKHVILNQKSVAVIKTLDSRGILQSIASKNNYDDAMQALSRFDINQYFLYPKINWRSKSDSLKEISADLNIDLDTFAFIDDEPFELDEIHFTLPSVAVIHAHNITNIIDSDPFKPKYITNESKNRRKMYLNDYQRKNLEAEFSGSKEEFLKILGLKFTVSRATEDDLKRAEEPTVRTNQLNTTGYTYSYEKLAEFKDSAKHILLIVELEDRYGSYGKIGLVLLEKQVGAWVIKLLLMSCRVISRGVGSILIHYLRHLSKKNNMRLLAEFIPTSRNRMMWMTYRFTGFKGIEKRGNVLILENNLYKIPDIPAYVDLIDRSGY
jgi:FkbH-like protein